MIDSIQEIKYPKEVTVKTHQDYAYKLQTYITFHQITKTKQGKTSEGGVQ